MSVKDTNVGKEEFLQEVLRYHQFPRPGKLGILTTKPLDNPRDLALAYSPGVALPCTKIAENIQDVYKYTARRNRVAVISNGTAVLGLGNLGAAASKPVMEGKAALFKVFADIDAIDLEVNTQDPEEFIKVVSNLQYSFGGINLEDIKAPECFMIEERLQELLDIPVFHDDQHGTAIVLLAGIMNAALVTNRKLTNMRVVVNGAGAAAIACLELLLAAGLNKEQVVLCDSQGVVFKGRERGMNKWKEKFATSHNYASMREAIVGTDVLIGLSVANSFDQEMIKSMNKEPIVFAMSNPNPEIMPEDVLAVAPDAIVATGRSDYPNQINNLLCFPYIFRGALDAEATSINLQMKLSAAEAIAQLAQLPVHNDVELIYQRRLSFGKNYLVPTPFDRRLLDTVPQAVAACVQGAPYASF
ncbi:MaeB-like malic enzyme [Rickettsiales endosymbiont of Paramecium tredecaurelia]|nr:MaeB-like malic enzyme [Candidatus Sarmatiella mevalonica]